MKSKQVALNSWIQFKFLFCLLAFIVFLPSVFAKGAKTEAKNLWGTWTLLRYEILDDTKPETSTDWCPHPSGVIHYLPSSWMSVAINCKDEKQNLISNPDDMVFYSGKYRVESDRIVHDVRFSSDLKRVGAKYDRFFKVKGDVITLEGKGSKGAVRLTWKKVQNSKQYSLNQVSSETIQQSMASDGEFHYSRLEFLSKPLLIIRGDRGVLACGYLNVATCERTGEACAIVSGVANFEDMQKASVIEVSPAAKKLGIEKGMPGKQALELLR